MKKLVKNVWKPMVFLVLLSSCSTIDETYNGFTQLNFNNLLEYGLFTDQQGNTYKTIQIGNQTWMAENLRTTKLNDGTPIAFRKGNKGILWTDYENPAIGTYGNTENGDTISTFGLIYNGLVINTGRLAPEGWHVPTASDWNELMEFVGTTNNGIGKLMESGGKHWPLSITWSSNETGFTAIPCGSRSESGYDNLLGLSVFYWSSTPVSLEQNNDGLFYGFYVYGLNAQLQSFEKSMTNRAFGCYVRLIKNKAIN